MRNKLKKYNVGVAGCIGILAIISVIYYLCVIWADWVIRTIWDKDINNWLIAASLFILGVFTPDKMKSWPMLMVAIGTVYIWIML